MVKGRHVGFWDATRWAFQRYFDFRGRSQRAEYWWFHLFTILSMAILTVFDMTLLGVEDPSEDFSPLADIFNLAVIIPTLAVGWRRMHDIGKSGWWTLLPLAPIIWTGAAAFVLFTSDDNLTAIGVVATILGVIVTLVSVVYVIVLLATDSDPSTNRYGPSPKYVGQSAALP